jgi:hypothetical protein
MSFVVVGKNGLVLAVVSWGCYLGEVVQMIGFGQLQAVSTNPVYPPFLLYGDFELIGRVVSMERDF